MKRFFQKNGIMMLAAVVVVAVGLCIASAVSNQTGFLQNAAGVVTYPFRAAGSAVTGWFQSIGERFQTVESLRKENEDLRKENAQLTEDLRQAKTDSEENQRLRDLNGLRQQRRDFTFEAAHVIERSTSNWSRTLTLNKGTSLGVERATAWWTSTAIWWVLSPMRGSIGAPLPPFWTRIPSWVPWCSARAR